MFVVQKKYLLTLQEALKLIHGLREEGNTLFKEGRYSVAIVKYESALPICEAHGFEANAVKLHSNAAAVYLKLNDFEAAGDHAEQCIALDPEFVKVHLMKLNPKVLVVHTQS